MGAILFANVSYALAAKIGSLTHLANEGGFHAPTIDEFFPEPFLFIGTPFAVNRVIMIRMLAVAVLVIVFVLFAKRAKLVPGRAQAAVEMLIDFVRVQIGHEIIGKDKAERYIPMLLTIFMGIFFMNMTGVIPGLQLAGTSIVGMPLIFAIYAWIGFIAAGVRAHGGLGYLKEAVAPAGVPKPVYLLLSPLEFISTFIVRPLSLTIRLLAAMVSGHFLLVLCFAATHALYLSLGGAAGVGLGTLTLGAGAAFIVLELFVSALQAYVFALLTAVYISLSLEAH